jgi:integrase
MEENSNSTRTNKRHAGGRPRKGSLEFRGGTWHVRLTLTVEGVAVRKWFSLNTDNKVVARRKAARLLAERQVPSVASAAIEAARPETYVELAKRVAANRRLEGIADCRTEESRESVWVIPVIGELPVASVRPEHIAGIYETARAKGRSLSLLRNLRTVLQSRFNTAIEEESIQSSPAARVRIPKAKVDRRERAVLTDTELAIYLAWTHPLKHRQLAVLERQTMSALARMFGGLRTGDIHALEWTHFDTSSTVEVTGVFSWGMALRKKTARPQRIEVPMSLRPILRDWWTRAGKPKTGHVFPPLRGKRVGTDDTTGESHAKSGVSHAGAMRRDLKAAFKAHRTANPKVPAEVLDGFCPAEKSERWTELFKGTEFTRPVDFHSWRRKFVQALADIGMNAQQAQKLAGHSDLAAHERYLRTTRGTLQIPIGALPNLTSRVTSKALPKLAAPDSQSSIYLEPTSRFELETCGLRSQTAERLQQKTSPFVDSDLPEASALSAELHKPGQLLFAKTRARAADAALTAFLRELATGYAEALTLQASEGAQS